MNQPAPRIELDRSRLLGFDQVPAKPAQPLVQIGAKVGQKPQVASAIDARLGAKVGRKPEQRNPGVDVRIGAKVGVKPTRG